ncbi:2-haloacid dehalogenase [Alicyclobacillus macrosporangiidus]|uniref:2-haloacid dehalogenase n=1 Tax=Alicyclobacillus macrosporangiidus TaxID=392015 RepID=A0A1I7L820_9BACL|nr:2-haloacid dehalogenase [Alicyclobacillus macrosporangiidus]
MIRAVVFDAYGTLFDVHSVVAACETAFPGYGTQIIQIWRQKQLEYTWLRALMGRYQDFERVTEDALKYTLNHLGLWYDEKTLKSLLSVYLHLTPFPEVPAALRVFHPRPLAILSNGTERMLQVVVHHAGLPSLFAHVLSVDLVKTYKPDPRVYELVTRTLHLQKEEILFVSSNGWDVAGAKSFGFTVAWVNRQRQTHEELGVQPDYVADDLLQLAHHVISQ